jgi:hypothetical protein
MDHVVLVAAAAMLLYVLIAVHKAKRSRGRRGRKRRKRSGSGDDGEALIGPPALGGLDLVYAIGLYSIILAIVVYLFGWAITGNSGWTAALGL